MNLLSNSYITATVEFPITSTLEEMANRLGPALGGVNFEREETGRFDEVPAFVAQQSEVHYVLFGVPEGETGDSYVLEVTAQTQLSVQDFREGLEGVMSHLLTPKAPNHRGYLDFSDELSAALRLAGMEECKAVL